MKKIKNTEFKFVISNLLCAEEHIVNYLTSNYDEQLIEELKEIKNKRNALLDLKGVDENKWCLVKHLMLAEYHLLELVNQHNEEEFNIKKLLNIKKDVNSLIEKSIDIKNVKCDDCKQDLKFLRFLKKQ